MAKCHWSLLCSPQPLARVLRALPKLAVVFLVVHVVVMIYTILTQTPPVPKNRKLENMNNNVKLAVDSARIAGNISDRGLDKRLVKVDKIDRLNLTKEDPKSLKQKYKQIQQMIEGRTGH